MKKDRLMDKLNAWFEDPNQPSYDSVEMFINAFEISFGGLGLGVKFKADPKNIRNHPSLNNIPLSLITSTKHSSGC
jgi:hypothetical protein